MRKLFYTLAIVLTYLHLCATTYTVKQDGTGDFTAIQEAISSQIVIDGDIILVYSGIYYENIDFNGKNIIVGSLYYTTQVTSYIDETVIDGNELESVVTFSSGETSSALLVGFTIRNGLGRNYPNPTGGGIFCNHTNPTLDHLIITENSSGFAGGGIFCRCSFSIIRNLTISNNTTQQYGGGLACDCNSNLILLNVTISSNETLETYPFNEDLYVYDLEGNIVPFVPEPGRNPSTGGGICVYHSDIYITNAIINENLCIEGGGIWTQSSNITLLDVDITNNVAEGSPFPCFGGLLCFWFSEVNLENVSIIGNSSPCVGGLAIKDNTTVSIIDGEISNNNTIADAGGIYISGQSTNLLMNNSIIDGNSTEGYGGGIAFYGQSEDSQLELDNVIITNNTAFKAGGLYCLGFSTTCPTVLRNVSITKNSAECGAGIYFMSSNPYLENVTIADNVNGGGIFCTDDTDVDFVNSISWNNLPHEIYFSENNDPNAISIIYSDIEGGVDGIVTNNNGIVYWNEGNIEEDPFFLDPINNDYSLNWTTEQRSPCIDTGNPEPEYNDPDGTRNDMGAIYHPHCLETYQFPNAITNSGWKWMCFPVIDRTIENNRIENLLSSILDEDILERAEYKPAFVEKKIVQYVSPTYWTNQEHPVISSEGYKFHMCCNEPQYIEVTGFLCPKNTEMELEGEDQENWLGYFIEKTLTVEDAFGSTMENLYSIQTQFWSMKREQQIPGSPWAGPELHRTLSYGDMVIVRCFQNCSFIWDYYHDESEEIVVEQSEHFTYTEQSDYIPIFVELDPNNLPTEISVKVDNVCKGAAVVQDTVTQICAYILNGNGGNLEFEMYYGTKGFDNNTISDYFVYDPITKSSVNRKITLGENMDYYLVSFKDKLVTVNNPLRLEAYNYPNPFNPETVISYQLPFDGDVQLTIYNIKGQIVKKLVDGNQNSGKYDVMWNGKDNAGNQVSSGIYLYRIKTKEKTISKKMVLVQ